jgi:hypothetical protein
MRFLISLVISIFLSFNAYAANLSNCVEGLDSSGDSVTGTFKYNKCMDCNTCNKINNCENVSGVITDQSGNVRTYKGHWLGYGRIAGMADDGTRVLLDVINR